MKRDTKTKGASPSWLERHMSAFELAEKFARGDKGAVEKMRAAFNIAMNDEEARGPFTGTLGAAILKGEAPADLFKVGLDTDYGGYLSEVAEHFIKHGKETGITPTWSKASAREVWTALIEKKGSGGKGLLAFAKNVNTPVCAQCPLYRWGVYERPEGEGGGGKGALVRTAVAAAMAGDNGTSKDRKAELNTLITTAKAAKDEAIMAEDFGKAQELKEEISRLTAEIEKVNTKVALQPPDRKSEIETIITAAKANQATAIKEENFARAGEFKEEIAKYEAELKTLTTAGGDDEEDLEDMIASSGLAESRKQKLMKRLAKGEDEKEVKAAFHALVAALAS